MPASEEIKDLLSQTLSQVKEQAHKINNFIEDDLSVDYSTYKKLDRDFSKLHMQLQQLENEISFL